jgi:hypothetical protein
MTPLSLDRHTRLPPNAAYQQQPSKLLLSRNAAPRAAVNHVYMHACILAKARPTETEIEKEGGSAQILPDLIKITTANN